MSQQTPQFLGGAVRPAPFDGVAGGCGKDIVLAGGQTLDAHRAHRWHRGQSGTGNARRPLAGDMELALTYFMPFFVASNGSFAAF